MKKVIRLTESDLMRIVKRVINESSNKRVLNEIMGSPYSLFNNRMSDFGYLSVEADKFNKILPMYNTEHVVFIYIRKKNDENSQWKTTTYDKGMDDKNFDNFINPNSSLWTKVTDSSLINQLNVRAKEIIYANRTPYEVLSQEPTVKNIVNMLKSSKSRGALDLGGDEEAYAEAAFMTIDSKQKYLEVKKMLGQDPYQFVKNFMDTSEVYHKKSIDSSMTRLGYKI
jgi:hypothetical protein